MEAPPAGRSGGAALQVSRLWEDIFRGIAIAGAEELVRSGSTPLCDRSLDARADVAATSGRDATIVDGASGALA